MRAFLFYIDDWLSSKSIERMDALEELGFLYLLIRQAADDTCTLPDDDDELSILSRLGRQWFKPTKDRDKRIGDMTSGQKLRREFDPHDGRIFNARMYREWKHQKEVSDARKKVGILGGEASAAKRSKAQPIGIDLVQQRGTNDVSASASVSQFEVSSGGAGGDFERVFCDESLKRGVDIRRSDPDFLVRVVEIAKPLGVIRGVNLFCKLMQQKRFYDKPETYFIKAFEHEAAI